jgi:hypothetical protein
MIPAHKLNPIPLKTMLTDAVSASRLQQKIITFTIAESNLQISVHVGECAIDFAYRRPKGEVSLCELEKLLTLADLDLIALCQRPGSKQGEPWWVATTVPKKMSIIN